MNKPALVVKAKEKIINIGNNKHWYGYKRHVSVDMQSGLINKVAVTPANVSG